MGILIAPHITATTISNSWRHLRPLMPLRRPRQLLPPRLRRRRRHRLSTTTPHSTATCTPRRRPLCWQQLARRPNSIRPLDIAFRLRFHSSSFWRRRPVCTKAVFQSEQPMDNTHTHTRTRTCTHTHTHRSTHRESRGKAISSCVAWQRIV